MNLVLHRVLHLLPVVIVLLPTLAPLVVEDRNIVYTMLYYSQYVRDTIAVQSVIMKYSNNDSESIVIICPGLSSLYWCIRLYSIVLAILGIALSFIWIIFQLYILSQTTNQELRLLRYLDIFLGIILFISMLCLFYGSYFYSQIFITAFITTSLGVIIFYWCLFLYYTFNNGDLPLYDNQVSTVLILLILHNTFIPGWLYWSTPDCTLPAPQSPCPPALPCAGPGP